MVLLFLAAAMVGVDLVRGHSFADPVEASGQQPTDSHVIVPPPPGAEPAPHPPSGGPTTQPSGPSIPRSGTGTFATAPGDSPTLGRSGTLQRFQVAVEEGVGMEATGFAKSVERTLGDARSWIAGGGLRLQRVGSGAHDFTIYLATAVTSERMCREGGLQTGQYTSCRINGKVILNLDRWLTAVPGYGAPLEVYQTYVINHEVGHQLGHNHEACPGQGKPAPVMQQQTLKLDGCTANPWPYVEGRRYKGPPAGNS